MRKLLLLTTALLLPCAAQAADMAYKAAPIPQMAAVTSWTGFYAGLHAGYVTSNVTVTDLNGGVPAGPFGYKPNGGMGGVTAGYNYQFSNFLLGIEGDAGYMASKGRGVIGSSVAVAHQDLTLDSGWYGDITARAGFVVADTLLLYGKGGWAVWDTDARQTTTNPGYQTTGTGQMSGWVAGGGAEWMFMRNMSVKVEYLHFDMGNKGGTQTNVGDLSSPLGFQFNNSTKLTMDTVKVGLAAHF